MRMFDEYVGLPFKDHGRTREGLDCYGLFALVYKEMYGIELPQVVEYASAADLAEVKNLIEGHLSPWHKVDLSEATTGDGLLMTYRGVPAHIGFIVKQNLVLHIEEAQRFSVIEDYSGYRLKKRILGAYRYHP